MKKITWWLRVVGVFYLLLSVVNIYAIFFNNQMYYDTLPFPADNLAVRAFVDAWMVFIFELGVLGGMMLYASRQPEKSGILVLTVIWAEVFRGIVGDGVWILRGYPAATYLPFIAIHLVIIITGVIFLRQSTKAGLSHASP